MKKLIWTPELVSKFWNSVSNSRLNELSFSKAAGKSLVTLVKSYIAASGTVLDFGCGDGYLLNLLSDLGFKCYGFEPSETRRKNLENLLVDSVNFKGFVQNGDEHKFNCVICAEVIEHVLDDDFEGFIIELTSRVQDGGYLIITTPNNEDLDLNMAYCPTSDVFFHKWQHVRSFDKDKLERIFSELGFEKIVSHQVELSKCYFEDYDIVWNASSNSVPTYFDEFSKNRSINVGNQSNLVYVGRKPFSKFHKIKKFVY